MSVNVRVCAVRAVRVRVCLGGWCLPLSGPWVGAVSRDMATPTDSTAGAAFLRTDLPRYSVRRRQRVGRRRDRLGSLTDHPFRKVGAEEQEELVVVGDRHLGHTSTLAIALYTCMPYSTLYAACGMVCVPWRVLRSRRSW